MSILLSDIAAGSGGFMLAGVSAYDSFGYSVSGAGDINGDGFDDLIVGALFADPHGSGSGASYVVFGRATGFAAAFDASTLDGTNGFKLSGVAAGDVSGTSVSNAGDVNDDGFDDLIVGARYASLNGNILSGASYVVLGRASGFAANLDLSALDGANGFRLAGAAALEYAGRSVSEAGDINGDGFADLIIGAEGANPNNLGDAGVSYVVFGHAAGFPANLDLSALDGANGFRLAGAEANSQSGFSVSNAGDVNGDGFDDLIVGTRVGLPFNPTGAGASYVVFGHAGGFAASLNLSALDGTSGFKLSGVAPGDQAGRSVSSAGDVNGDGFADLIIGARGADPHGASSGASYVVFGHGGGFAANLDLSTLDGTNGFRLSGTAANDQSGIWVSNAGDFNGDGFDDVAVGAIGAPGGTFFGALYVVFGHATGFAPNLELSALDGSNGVTITGVTAQGLAGYSVSSAGDINGDGFDDLIAGARTANPLGRNSGASYVIYGGDFAGAVTHTGSSSADALDGTGASDTLLGGLGDDTLTGAAGNDLLNGGAGIDTAVFSGNRAAYTLTRNRATDGFTISGPDGTDRLRDIEVLRFADSSTLLVSDASDAGIVDRFDPFAYLAGNPGLIGVFGNDTDAALAHYLRFGFDEGRPIAGFNAYRYLASNPGLLDFYGPDAPAATAHYVNFGYTEGRPTTAFDPFEYLASNPGLIAPLGTGADAASEHYAKFGRTEGRPATSFSVNQYLATNQTLIPFFTGNAAGAIEHFVKFGYAEGRPANGFFGQLYLASNPTLIDTLAHTTAAETLETTATHYVQTGYAQGLHVEGFNPLQYLASNLGLLNFYGPDAFAAINHYIDFGFHEGRATSSFDGLEYIASNPGLIPFFGTNADAGIAHYVFNGFTEGRATVSFNAQQYHDNYGDLEGHSLTDARLDFINGGFAQGRTDAALPGSAGATAGAEELDGGNGADLLSGLAGNDTLAGGLGNDTLVGGYDSDLFVFDMAPDAATNLDRIVDFTHGADKVVLENAVFTALVNAGALAAGSFAANTTGSAVDADDFVLYNTVSGVLSYDADGSGAGAAVAFATLASHPAITAADFLVI